LYIYGLENRLVLSFVPYGRLQGVLTDKNTVAVSYDYMRGESRARFNRHEERTAGDCVDCGDCVKVCPTGIDIRNGSQMECVACTACIDACDSIMEKFNFEKGLIRYASEANIANKEKWSFTPRIKAYTAVLVILIGVLTVLLFSRKEISTTVMRAQGQLYQMQGEDTISNLYNIKLVNKTFNDFQMNLKVLSSSSGFIRMVGKDLQVKKESIGDGVFFIEFPKEELTKRKTEVEIGIFAGDKLVDKVKTNFMAPIY
jgi:cytochrome c oxidase accessory protein FixG